jgi:hypothetical protein
VAGPPSPAPPARSPQPWRHRQQNDPKHMSDIFIALHRQSASMTTKRQLCVDVWDVGKWMTIGRLHGNTESHASFRYTISTLEKLNSHIYSPCRRDGTRAGTRPAARRRPHRTTTCV